MSTALQLATTMADFLAQQPDPAPSKDIISIMEFRALPKWLIPLAASVIFLFLFKSWGDKVSASDNRWLDLLLDLGTLASAGSIVATLSSWPLMQSFAKLIATPISKFSWTVPGIGWQIGGTALLLVITVVLAWRYVSTETWPMLIVFGLFAQVLALSFSQINYVFGFWINFPIRGVWFALIWLIELIPNISFNVS